MTSLKRLVFQCSVCSSNVFSLCIERSVYLCILVAKWGTSYFHVTQLGSQLPPLVVRIKQFALSI